MCVYRFRFSLFWVLALAALCIQLSGCAGVNISWNFSASQNTDVVTRTQSVHIQPRLAESEQASTPAKPASGV